MKPLRRNSTPGHWNRVYRKTSPEEASWHEATPSISLGLIERGAPPPDRSVLDVGGGASRLAAHLLEAGYRRVGVLDISARALGEARARLGRRAEGVEWIEGDVTAFRPRRRWDVWHDRALLHFMTEPEDRTAYRERLLETLSPGGCAVLGTFGPHGPERCSGLPCVRYDLEDMAAFLGEPFELEEHVLHDHSTPSGDVQQFLHARYRRRDASDGR